MKRILLIILLFTIFGCSKEFLKKTDPTRIEEGRFYSDLDEMNRALTGVYGMLQDVTNSDWEFSELPADNTTIDLNPNDRGQASNREQFEFWQYNPGTPDIESLYDRYYSAISNANLSILKLSEMEDDSNEKGEIEGQLKFLRGYFYFNLTRYFGDLILITEPLDNPAEAFEFERVSQIDVFDQIEKDLKDAVELLPDSYPGAELGRVTKGAAMALLGELFMTEERYKDAVELLTPITSMDYELLDEYSKVFDPSNKNNAESVFEVQYQAGNDLDVFSNFTYEFSPRLSEGEITGFSQSTPGGWGIPTTDLISEYEENDLRKNASIGFDFQSHITGETVPYIKKYNHKHSNYGETDDNWPVIRFSGVLLLLAEAINEANHGPNSLAYECLNKVRNRAGLDDLNGLSEESFRNAVYHERRVELAFENDRWFFLKRVFNDEDLTYFLNQYGQKEREDPSVNREGIPFSTNDYVFKENLKFFPIPDEEIKTNPSLVQNPGY